MKALITGITGQCGSYLSELLLEKGYEVHGIIRRSSSFNTSRIDHMFKELHLHYGDLSDSNNISTLISEIKPDEIYNLGAQSHVKVSFEIPEYTSDIDALGSLRVLDAVKTFCPNSKVYQASTSELYGGQYNEMPVTGFDENTPFHPRSPYAVAKLYSYWIMKNYREAYNMFTCNGIIFNNESPRRTETFVTKKITTWVGKNYKKILNDEEVVPLYLGNIHAKRDWSHSKDAVNAMYLILQQDKPDDYVIASGQTQTIKTFVEKCFGYVDLSITWEGTGLNEIGICNNIPVVKIDEKYFRPSEVDCLLGNPTKAKQILKWKPEYNFELLIKDMMDYEIYGKK
jgi:GDPmannose 4,6-dehydratase